MTIKRIGIITSGGDCGGLNAVLKGAARMATAHGATALVIPNGYAGLYNLVDLDHLVELTPSRVDSVSIGLAGSEAGHSRIKISKISDPHKYDRIREGLNRYRIDGLVISGGDDTGSVVVDLSQHNIPCVHAPKTMDLDLMPYSVGGDSTIQRIADFVRDLKTTGRSHNRILVVEVFGRHAGHTAFRGGVAAEADCILIPEVPVDFDVVYRDIKRVYCRRMIESDINAATYIIVVAEGLKNASGEPLYDKSVPPDAFGHYKLTGAGKFVCQQLEQLMAADPELEDFMKKQGLFVKGLYERPEIRSVVPGHLVRCGFSSAYDDSFGMEAGAAAVELLMAGRYGVTVVGYVNGVIQYMPTKEAIKQRYVNLTQVALYEQLGFCFGQDLENTKPSFVEVTGEVPRIY